MLEKVLKRVKVDRAPGVDDVPIALYNALPETSGLMRQMIQIMWQYEVLPDSLPVLLQVMIHKTGRTHDLRKNYRPVTLQNDLLKVLDACVYYMLARETGTVPEPPPGETEVRPPYMSQTQRAYQQNRSSMDLLLITRLVQQWGLATGLNVLDGQ
eukprot:SAG31_NODE_14398_length_809_cov_1.263380_2_plen_154_part_01